MVAPVIVCTDFDRTLFRQISSTYLIRHNATLDPKAALRRMLDARLIDEGLIQGFQVVRKRTPDTLTDLADLMDWAFYDRKGIPVEAIIAIKSILMQGLRVEDLKLACAGALDYLTPGAVEYSRRLTNSGVIHVILSYGVLPIIEAVAKHLVSQGARIDAVFGREPIIEGGLVTGFKESGSKWKFAFELYDRYGLRTDANGVFQEAGMVDDSSENLDHMKKHGRPVAFNPTQLDALQFAMAGVPVCTGTLAEAVPLLFR